jgi:diphthamide biosynthesis methyltransferase
MNIKHVEIITTLDLYTYRVAIIHDGRAISATTHTAADIVAARNGAFERAAQVAPSVHASPIPAIFNVHPWREDHARKNAFKF